LPGDGQRRCQTIVRSNPISPPPRRRHFAGHQHFLPAVGSSTGGRHMKSTPSFLVVGSANTDMSIKLDRLPRAGETILGGDFSTASGGKGANQAVSAARAGDDVAFIGRSGSDAFGDNALANLAADGINVEHVIRARSNPPGIALILV